MHDKISQYLAFDHDELDGMFTDLIPNVEDGEWEQALDHFEEFDTRLRRHMDIEENILFPVFDERVRPDGPTRIMRFEHDRIRLALEMMLRAIQQHDEREFFVGRRELDGILPDHNLKEERILYPIIDELLGADAGATLERVKSA